MDAIFHKLTAFPGFILVLVGLFYVFAGFVLARHILLDRVLTRAIEMVAMETPNRVETHRRAWMIGSAVLVFAAGTALVMQSVLAVWLFCASLLQQVAYLLWLAPRYFDRGDEPDEAGRRQTTNATILFGAVTLGVIAAATYGALLPVAAEGTISSVATAGVTVAFVLWTFARSRMSATGDDALDVPEPPEDEEQPLDMMSVDGLRLAAEWFELPVLVTFDDERSDFYSGDRLGLSSGLTIDLDEWQHAYSIACENVGEGMAPVWSDDVRDAHFARAETLAGRIRDELLSAGLDRIEVSWKRADGEIGVVG